MRHDQKHFTLFITPDKRHNYKSTSSKPVDNRNLKPLLKMISKAAKSRAVMYFHILQSNYPKPAETILFIKSRG